MSGWYVPEPVPVDWESLSTEAPVLIKAAEDAAARWLWARDGADWEIPLGLWPQRVGRDPVLRAIRGKPDPMRAVRYGYAHRGRLPVIATDFVGGASSPVPGIQTVRLLHKPRELITRFRCFRRPGAQMVIEAELVYEVQRDDNGRTVEVTTYFRPGFATSDWHHEFHGYDADGQLIEVRAEGRWREGEVEGSAHRGVIWRAEYDATGALAVVRGHDLDEHGELATAKPATISWQRTEKAVLRDAEAFLVRELPRAALAWLGRQRVTDEVYGFGILFNADCPDWAPSFGLGTVPELRSWGSAGSEQRLARIWNPAEFACFDPVPDELATPAFREAVRMTAQAWGDEAAAKVRRICVGAAKQLSKPAADVIQRPARSFVVFAADLDADDADPAVRRTVPASTRRTLEQLADEATPPPDPAASRGGGR